MRNIICLAAVVALAVPALADTFGTGSNAFTIDFVPISGDAGNLGSWSAGDDYTFSGVNHGGYRMGTYEISNDQWNKFKAAYGEVNGSQGRYSYTSYFTSSNVPTNNASWYEAAQFVNWLNTSTGHQAAYKFTGSQGTNDYTFTVWDVTDTGYDAGNPYRNSNAFYFLPTENEWVKAAYWNGTNLQTYATKAGESLYQGNGSNGGWNYYNNGYATNPYGPWAVGSGSEELNGTFDMMGNVWEWMESPVVNGDYLSDSRRGRRGASYHQADGERLASSIRVGTLSTDEVYDIGFRVASIPEPCTLLLLGLGGVLIRKR